MGKDGNWANSEQRQSWAIEELLTQFRLLSPGDARAAAGRERAVGRGWGRGESRAGGRPEGGRMEWARVLEAEVEVEAEAEAGRGGNVVVLTAGKGRAAVGRVVVVASSAAWTAAGSISTRTGGADWSRDAARGGRTERCNKGHSTRAEGLKARTLKLWKREEEKQNANSVRDKKFSPQSLSLGNCNSKRRRCAIERGHDSG